MEDFDTDDPVAVAEAKVLLAELAETKAEMEAALKAAK